VEAGKITPAAEAVDADLLAEAFEWSASGPAARNETFNITNGSDPMGALVQGANGTLYGTTSSGGTNGGYGTVFQITTNGQLTTLISFNNTNGANPLGALARTADGTLFGTTSSGGVSGTNGTVFQISTNGQLTTLVSFNGTNGANPYSGLIRASEILNRNDVVFGRVSDCTVRADLKTIAIAAPNVGHVVASAAGEHIIAAWIGDAGLDTSSKGVKVLIAFLSHQEPIVASAAVQRIIANFADYGGEIVLIVAAERVISVSAKQLIITAVAVNLIVAFATVEEVVAIAAGDQVGAAGAEDAVVARAPVEHHVGYRPGDIDLVIAGAAVDNQLFNRAAGEVLGAAAIEMHHDVVSGESDSNIIGAGASIDGQHAAGKGGGQHLAGFQLFDKAG